MMARCQTLAVILTIAVLSPPMAMGSADTWRVQQDETWEPVPAKDQDTYLLAVARTEQFVSTGQSKALAAEWSKLKPGFTEIEESDLDTFIKAEVCFCRGKFSKAAMTYSKFLDKDYEESALYQAALERQLHIASAFLGGRKVKLLRVFEWSGSATGIKMMEKITERAEGRPIATQATVAAARHYEQRGKFPEAYLKWAEVSWQQQYGQLAREALLAMARCKHATYRGPKHNAAHLRSAKTYYEAFRARYPEEAAKLNIDDILKEIDEQMAYKQLTIGQYYQRIGKTQAANLYYDMVIRNWSETKAAEMARDMLTASLQGEQKEK
jgi:hypothetical protein